MKPELVNDVSMIEDFTISKVKEEVLNDIDKEVKLEEITAWDDLKQEILDEDLSEEEIEECLKFDSEEYNDIEAEFRETEVMLDDDVFTTLRPCPKPIQIKQEREQENDSVSLSVQIVPENSGLVRNPISEVNKKCRPKVNSKRISKKKLPIHPVIKPVLSKDKNLLPEPILIKEEITSDAQDESHEAVSISIKTVNAKMKKNPQPILIKQEDVEESSTIMQNSAITEYSSQQQGKRQVPLPVVLDKQENSFVLEQNDTNERQPEPLNKKYPLRSIKKSNGQKSNLFANPCQNKKSENQPTRSIEDIVNSMLKAAQFNNNVIRLRSQGVKRKWSGPSLNEKSSASSYVQNDSHGSQSKTKRARHKVLGINIRDKNRTVACLNTDQTTDVNPKPNSYKSQLRQLRPKKATGYFRHKHSVNQNKTLNQNRIEPLSTKKVEGEVAGKENFCLDKNKTVAFSSHIDEHSQIHFNEIHPRQFKTKIGENISENKNLGDKNKTLHLNSDEIDLISQINLRALTPRVKTSSFQRPKNKDKQRQRKNTKKMYVKNVKKSQSSGSHQNLSRFTDINVSSLPNPGQLKNIKHIRAKKTKIPIINEGVKTSTILVPNQINIDKDNLIFFKDQPRYLRIKRIPIYEPILNIEEHHNYIETENENNLSNNNTNQQVNVYDDHNYLALTQIQKNKTPVQEPTLNNEEHIDLNNAVISHNMNQNATDVNMNELTKKQEEHNCAVDAKGIKNRLRQSTTHSSLCLNLIEIENILPMSSKKKINSVQVHTNKDHPGLLRTKNTRDPESILVKNKHQKRKIRAASVSTQTDKNKDNVILVKDQSRYLEAPRISVYEPNSNIEVPTNNNDAITDNANQPFPMQVEQNSISCIAQFSTDKDQSRTSTNSVLDSVRNKNQQMLYQNKLNYGQLHTQNDQLKIMEKKVPIPMVANKDLENNNSTQFCSKPKADQRKISRKKPRVITNKNNTSKPTRRQVSKRIKPSEQLSDEDVTIALPTRIIKKQPIKQEVKDSFVPNPVLIENSNLPVILLIPVDFNKSSLPVSSPGKAKKTRRVLNPVKAALDRRMPRPILIKQEREVPRPICIKQEDGVKNESVRIIPKPISIKQEPKDDVNLKKKMIVDLKKYFVNGLYRCIHCPYTAKFKTYLKDHLVVHRSKEEVPIFKCHLCTAFESKYRSAYYIHMSKHRLHSDANKKILKCDAQGCSYQSPDKWLLKQHIVTHLTFDVLPKYECDVCDFKTKYRCSIVKHVLRHKDPEEITMHKCDSCSYQTKYKDALHFHKRLVHGDKNKLQTFRCYKCSYETIRKNHLKRHLEFHQKREDKEKLKSKKCNSLTRKKKNLGKKCKETHACACAICGHKSLNKDCLRNHVISVHTDLSKHQENTNLSH